MPWNRTLNDLQLVLADLYPGGEDARRVAEQAGLAPAHVNFSNAAIKRMARCAESSAAPGTGGCGDRRGAERVSDSQALAQAAATYKPAEVPPEAMVPRIIGRWPWLCPPSLVELGDHRSDLADRAWHHAASPPPVTPSPTLTSTATATVMPAATATAATTATMTATPTSTATAPRLTETPTPSASAQQTPVFVSEWVYDLSSWTEQTEYRYEAGILPSETITDFLRLTRVELGQLSDASGPGRGSVSASRSRIQGRSDGPGSG